MRSSTPRCTDSNLNFNLHDLLVVSSYKVSPLCETCNPRRSAREPEANLKLLRQRRPRGDPARHVEFNVVCAAAAAQCCFKVPGAARRCWRRFAILFDGCGGITLSVGFLSVVVPLAFCKALRVNKMRLGRQHQGFMLVYTHLCRSCCLR
jgi:hypothetical protein